MRASAVILAVFLIGAMSCGGASKRGAAVKTQSPAEQIRQLEAQNNSLSQSLGIQPHVTETGTTDAGTKTTAVDPGRQPQVRPQPRASTCSDVCRITTSICNNADRICRIAREKLPDDDWARGRCEAANKSCTAAKARCDKCKASE